MRNCTHCHKEKPITSFYTRNGKPKNWCKDCEKAYQKAFYANNPERQRKRAENYRARYAAKICASKKANRSKHYLYELSHKYGVSQLKASELLMLSNGMCVCCGVRFDEQKLSKRNLDHCHTCGSPRGFICARCNQILGLAEDNQTRLLLCVNYIRNHQCTTS